jgi:hypothetical protein
MKKLGLIMIVAMAALSRAPAPAGADDQVFYCDLTGYGYGSPDGDSYQFCMDNCYLDTSYGRIYGDCWHTPGTPPGGPHNED